jgi:hypothetical protein
MDPLGRWLLRLLGKLGVYFLNGCLIVGLYGLLSEHVAHSSDERLSVGIFLFGAIGVSMRLLILRMRRLKTASK